MSETSSLLVIADSRIIELDSLLDMAWTSAIIVQTLLPTEIKDQFAELDAALDLYFDNDESRLRKVLVVSGPHLEITQKSYTSTFKTLKKYLLEHHKVAAEKIILSLAADCELTIIETSDFSDE